jgi:hypothetical protein
MFVASNIVKILLILEIKAKMQWGIWKMHCLVFYIYKRELWKNHWDPPCQSFHRVKNQSAAGRICHANFVSAEEPWPYVLPVGSDGELGEIKFNDKWANDIEHSLDEILPLIITDQPDKLAYWPPACQS